MFSFSHQPLQSIRPFAAAGRKKAETGRKSSCLLMCILCWDLRIDLATVPSLQTASLLEDDDSSSVVIPTRPEVIGERVRSLVQS